MTTDQPRAPLGAAIPPLADEPAAPAAAPRGSFRPLVFGPHNGAALERAICGMRVQSAELRMSAAQPTLVLSVDFLVSAEDLNRVVVALNQARHRAPPAAPV